VAGTVSWTNIRQKFPICIQSTGFKSYGEKFLKAALDVIRLDKIRSTMSVNMNMNPLSSARAPNAFSFSFREPDSLQLPDGVNSQTLHLLTGRVFQTSGVLGLQLLSSYTAFKSRQELRTTLYATLGKPIKVIQVDDWLSSHLRTMYLLLSRLYQPDKWQCPLRLCRRCKLLQSHWPVCQVCSVSLIVFCSHWHANTKLLF
jgi:hypothetical protein